MALRRIIKYGHPYLRVKSQRVEKIDDEIRNLVDDMIETMIEAEGIGLAAPQVAQTLSLLVINNTIIEEDAEPQAYINPTVYDEAGEIVMEEGCLSIPDIREDVKRPESVKVKYTDLDGEECDEQINGMLARVMLHEVDHLNGVLFIDKISPMKRKLLSKKLKKIASGD